MAWLKPVADSIRENRRPVDESQPMRVAERALSERISASLDYYRDLRDAVSEAQFFQTYGNLFSLYLTDKHEAEEKARAPSVNPRQMPFVKEALAAIDQGGYAAALARVAYLLSRKGEPLPLERIVLKKQLLEEYSDLLPQLEPDEIRRNRGVQEIIVDFEPKRALDTLPQLLAAPEDRSRFAAFFDRFLHDERIVEYTPTPEQLEMLARIRTVLGLKRGAPSRLKAVKTSALQRSTR